MNIGLMAMSGVRIQTPELAKLGVTLPGFVRRGKVIASLPSLGLLTVAGLTPPEHQVTYLEIDQLDQIDLPDFDLVGISSLTARIHDAYLLADRYRQRKIPVVMGGLHVSVMPEEALAHADAVVMGGAEKAWPELVQDFVQGKLGRIYEGARDRVFAKDYYGRPRFDLLRGRSYHRLTVQTSRGCPRSCEFCGASLLISQRFNQKPVEQIMAEIREARRWFPESFFEFADDNSFLNKRWSKSFLQALCREEIHYFTETDASVAHHPELCDLLADSGCKQLLIGFESHSPSHLEGIDPHHWKKKQVSSICQTIDVLQSRGIGVIGCFILGLDAHTPDTFPQILEFVKSSGVADVQYTVLTPFPGTPLYTKLLQEKRLVSEKFWDQCTLFDVTYRPKNMTIEELEEGVRWLFRNSYNPQITAERRQHFEEQRWPRK